MTANEIVATFLDALLKNDTAHAAYVSNRSWTALATAALIEAGMAASTGEKLRAAARGTKDPDYKRSEYLTLDVCVYDNASWGPPLFIAEHENSSDVLKVQYCAWRLLCTQASRRVLVAYYAKTVGMKGLVAAVHEVAAAVAAATPGGEVPREVLVIAAPWEASPATNVELRALFETSTVGVR